MKFIMKKVSDHGLGNPIVARLGFQASELLKHSDVDQGTKDDIADMYMNILQPKLLRCWEIAERFRAEFNAAVAEYENAQPQKHAIEVPQIMRLEEEANNFLYETKSYLRGIMTVVNLAYGTDYEEASELILGSKKNGRPTPAEFMRKSYGHNSAQAAMYQEAADAFGEFIWCRNAVEHPGGRSGTLRIVNFELEPDRRLAEPHWIREADGLAGHRAPMRHTYTVGLENLLMFAEDVLVCWLEERLAHADHLAIYEIPLERRDPKCPMRWSVGATPALEEKLKELRDKPR